MPSMSFNSKVQVLCVLSLPELQKPSVSFCADLLMGRPKGNEEPPEVARAWVPEILTHPMEQGLIETLTGWEDSD